MAFGMGGIKERVRQSLQRTRKNKAETTKPALPPFAGIGPFEQEQGKKRKKEIEEKAALDKAIQDALLEAGIGGDEESPLVETPVQLPLDPGLGPTTPTSPIGLPEEAGLGTLIGDPFRDIAGLQNFQQQIEKFGRRQEEQLRQIFQVQEQQREQRLGDLASFLGQEETRRFEEAQPQIEESLNTRGLLRSSALGEALASERGRLEQETQAALLGQGLSDREAAILGVEQIAQPRIQSQQAGLERFFSLEDIERESKLARDLAELGVPHVPSQSGGGFSLGGALGGGLLGASFGGGLPGIIGGGLLGGLQGGGGGGGK